ncbi:MAG: single-stranded-DNA-specific exonuclease RecJ, partial [Chloroflexota bacterium]
MRKRWIDPVPVDVPEVLREAVGGHPLIAETLVRRGIRSGESAGGFLSPDRYRPAFPSGLADMDSAVARLRFATRMHEPICVWGDFDV